MAIRFHLDENVDHVVALGLRLRGIDVTTSTDAYLVGADDERQLAYAHGEGRVLLTHDADFLTLHATGVEHSGIAFCAKNARTVGEIIRHLCLIHDLLAPKEMRDCVEFV